MCLAVLLWLAATVPAASAATLSAAGQTLNPGQTGVVALTLASAGQAVSGFQFDLSWDSSVDVQVTAGTQALAASRSLYTAHLQNGALRCLVAGTNSAAVADGEVIRLFVTVHANAVAGAAALAFTNLYAASPTAAAVAMQATSISIPIQTTAPLVSTLSVSEGTTAFSALNWPIGSPIPGITLHLLSPNQPLSFTAAVSSTPTASGGVANWASISPTSGVATTTASALTVSFNPVAFLQAKPGDVLSGSVTIGQGSAAPIAIPFQYTVLPPAATVTSLIPSEVPVDTTPGDIVTVVISGAGFVSGPAGQTTQVTLNGAKDPAVAVTVVNAATITVAIPADAAARYLASPQSISIGVQNPNGSPAGSAASVSALTVTSRPIIRSMASAATYLEPAPGASPTFAPYDIVAIFGTNFCLDCAAANAPVLIGTPDPIYARYPPELSPDGTHRVSVQFEQTAGGNPAIGPGYLLFASNTELHVLVPAEVAALAGPGTARVRVSYGPAGTAVPSTPYSIDIEAVDPGILTLNSDGQGQGAILHPDYSVNSSTNKAVRGSVISIFVTGLGAPTSTSSNVNVSSALTYPSSCISPLGTSTTAGYLTTVNTVASGYVPPNPAWTSIDGAVVRSGYIKSGHLPPCLSGVAVTINGVSAAVSYAGFVADSIAGLYQINALVPATVAVPASGQVPVFVQVGGESSQAGVAMYIR